MVQVIWTAIALQGLHQLGVQPQIEQLIVNHINGWATTGAPGWALNALHQYNSPQPHYDATAQVTAIAGANRTVTIANFV